MRKHNLQLLQGGRQMLSEPITVAKTDYVVNIYDVAKTFLYFRPMSHKKLQKLCYYAEAWYLTLTGNKLSNSEFQAWVHGPVSPELYDQYRMYGLSQIQQQRELPRTITTNKRIFDFLSKIDKIYGDMSANELEVLTHSEDPWRIARKGFSRLEPCVTPICDDDIIRFYSQKLNKR